MKKKETLFDILLKVSELRMDIETAEKRILRCFNRWYNQNYLDAEKCKNCKHSEQKYYKNCLNCIEHSNFTK